MKKQEALNRIEAQKETIIELTGWAVYVYIEELIKSIDEPQKVKVPQCVGDYIEHAKESEWDLEDLFEFVGDQECGGIQKWFYDECNQDTLALAWINGYTIEKEKRYTIRFKNIRKETRYLKYDRVVENWYFGVEQCSKETKISHTRTELEEAGFGWVFDCEGIEIEEVTE
nr:MAG TPA: Protein of unknown function (DUF1642) [Caudoviricetes sp.]